MLVLHTAYSRIHENPKDNGLTTTPKLGKKHERMLTQAAAICPAGFTYKHHIAHTNLGILTVRSYFQEVRESRGIQEMYIWIFPCNIKRDVLISSFTDGKIENAWKRYEAVGRSVSRNRLHDIEFFDVWLGQSCGASAELSRSDIEKQRHWDQSSDVARPHSASWCEHTWALILISDVSSSDCWKESTARHMKTSSVLQKLLVQPFLALGLPC